jgi:hypothetical protein
MSKIYGNEKVIEAARKLQVGNPTNLISWDVLENLPEMFSGFVASVTFTIDDWEDVGNGNLMPSPDFVNKICEARGIFGCEGGLSEPIYQEVDWNRLCCKFNEPPLMVKMLVGYTATKQGKIMMEDGSMRPCDPCVVSYNAWERLCSDAWGKEEAATDYYSSEKIKINEKTKGKYYLVTWYNKTEGKEQTDNYYLKYDTRAKRQLSLDSELKFAQRKADTKARNVVIRIITGMSTGYTEKDLQMIMNPETKSKTGTLYFHRIQKSDLAIKAEQSAYLKRITDPGVDLDRPVVSDVFDDKPKIENKKPDPVIEKESKTKQEELIMVLKHYKDNDLIMNNLKSGTEALLEWLNSEKEAEKTEFWLKAIERLKSIEETIPEEMRISHSGIK